MIWLTYVNRCEDRELKRAKGADKPEPKGERSGSGATISPDADAAPPVERQSLSHPQGIYAERSKPVLFPLGKLTVR